MERASHDPDQRSLIARARRGDAAAFDALVRRHYRATFAVALAVVHRRADAEDVCQDAWVRALERLDELRDLDRFLPWLLQIVRNRARNFLDYQRLRAGPSLEANEAQESADPRQNLERERLRVRLEDALRELVEIQRLVVLMHDLDGWEHRAIAGALAISEVMSRQHLFQARRRLRERLGAGALEEFSHDD